ncbi:YcxB-like protein [Anaerocolumna jejuensis DSM 15929]|uniref:YcxB-like protein n=1 Tax=Anaerocolumna jejuensis DSM 15929 TaxID=1121322 RepID=A0A1M6JKS4_9FIRM|nr:YcxB family protein [Anaerocolumna jejuensis]SHJ47279.1 YcxB-like protein [Anaerocolumna jejuensis DSM 15929]
MEVKVRLTEEEYRDFSMIFPKIKRKSINKKTVVILTAIVCIVLILANVMWKLAVPASTSEPVITREQSIAERLFHLMLPLFLIITYVVLRLLRPLLVKKSAGKEFSSNKPAQKEISYFISSDYIEIISPDIHMTLHYEDIHQIFVTNKYIVLFESERLIRIIPKRCFENEAALQTAIQLLEQNVSKGKYITYKL